MKFSCHFIFFIICFSASIINSNFVNVPLPQFKSTLDSTMELVQNLASSMSTMSNFRKQGYEDGEEDRNLISVTSHCADVLGSTYEALSWSLSTIHQDTKGYKQYNGRGNVISHARTRLSTNVGSQKACSEVFDGTKYSMVAERFKQVMNSTNKLLGMLQVQQDSEAKAASAWNFLRTPNVTVSKDGSGNYRTVMEAIAGAPNHSQSYYVIFVKQGVYYEYVSIVSTKTNLVLIGQGMKVTTISGSRSNGTGWPTLNTATFGVSAEGFIAMDIGFENTAGPQDFQAVALLSSGDRSSFYRCKISGYQDTLLVQSGRAFFRECEISGSIDFIFGFGTAVFQNCVILVKANPGSGISVVTAHGRFAPNDPSGFSFQYCKLFSASDPRSNAETTLMYLGRPWGQYSRTLFMESYISEYIVPQGWLEWDSQSRLDTLYYGEYMNTGLGSNLSGRVKWPGYHIITDQSEADGFTAAKFIDGDSWLPSTGIPYTKGLRDQP